MSKKTKEGIEGNWFQEIDEMITTVDKNQDGKISYSEFRVTMSIKGNHHHNLGNNVYKRKPTSQSWKQCLSKETTITILVTMSIKGKSWSQYWKEMQVMLGAIPLLIPDPPPSGAKAAKPKEWKRAKKLKRVIILLTPNHLSRIDYNSISTM